MAWLVGRDQTERKAGLFLMVAVPTLGLDLLTKLLAWLLLPSDGSRIELLPGHLTFVLTFNDSFVAASSVSFLAAMDRSRGHVTSALLVGVVVLSLGLRFARSDWSTARRLGFFVGLITVYCFVGALMASAIPIDVPWGALFPVRILTSVLITALVFRLARQALLLGSFAMILACNLGNALSSLMPRGIIDFVVLEDISPNVQNAADLLLRVGALGILAGIAWMPIGSWRARAREDRREPSEADSG